MAVAILTKCELGGVVKLLDKTGVLTPRPCGSAIAPWQGYLIELPQGLGYTNHYTSADPQFVDGLDAIPGANPSSENGGMVNLPRVSL